MKLCKKEQSLQRTNGAHCHITECPIDEPTINMATCEISGRYPERGYAINHQVQEMVYLTEGRGSVTVNGVTSPIKKGDVVLIEPEDKFFWDGEFKAVIACSPAFTIEQHEIVSQEETI